MELEETETPLTERKVVRRGLLAGVAALTVGALTHFTTSPAQALDPQDIDMDTTNVSTAQTTLNSAAAGGSGYTVLRVENFRLGEAIQAIGGPGTSANAGRAGLSATGGNNTFGTSATPRSAGHGIVSTGGSAVGGVGTGGSGVKGTGGPGGTFVGGFGVEGTGGAPLGAGVFGTGGGDAGSQGYGVLGISNGSRAAVNGFNQALGVGIGVQGDANSGVGVKGTTVGGTGVSGETFSSTKAGVLGTNGSNGPGVLGNSTDGIGVLGTSTNQPGVDGVSVSSLGVRGTSTNFVGVVGISTNNHGLYGFTSSPSGVALVGDNGAGGLAGVFNGRVEVYGSFQVFGVKNAVLKMPDGSNALVYCQESPEPYFEDFGRAQLAGGVANVPIERDFATLVAGGDYMVFPVAEGETRGLFVSRRGPASFEVREMQGGTGNVPFTYRIVTRRKDVEGKRFARVSDQGAKSVAATRAALVSAGPPSHGAPGGNVTPPGPFVPPSDPQMPPPNTPRPPQDGPR